MVANVLTPERYAVLLDELGYADQHVQSPSDEDNARAIASLIAAGYIDRLLLSQDVFLKMMPSHYGGSAMPMCSGTSYCG